MAAIQSQNLQNVLGIVFVSEQPIINQEVREMKTSDVFEKFLKEVHHDYWTVNLIGVE